MIIRMAHLTVNSSLKWDPGIGVVISTALNKRVTEYIVL